MPRVETGKRQVVNGPIRGLGKAVAKVGQTMRTVDLTQAPKITVNQLQMPTPVSAIDTLVQAKQGSRNSRHDALTHGVPARAAFRWRPRQRL